jgi:hypothetical protein
MTATDPIPTPDLDAQLDVALDDTDTATSSGAFSIDTLEQANWAVRKIAQHRARFDEAQALADAEHERVDAWLRDQRHSRDKATGFLEALLRRFHEQRLDADPKAKTIKVPAGELTARKAPDRLEVDEEPFVAWARATGHDHLLRVTVAANKTEIRHAIGDVMADGRVVDGDTGEFMPGVLYVEGDVRFSVKTEGASR